METNTPLTLRCLSASSLASSKHRWDLAGCLRAGHDYFKRILPVTVSARIVHFVLECTHSLQNVSKVNVERGSNALCPYKEKHFLKRKFKGQWSLLHRAYSLNLSEATRAVTDG